MAIIRYLLLAGVIPSALAAVPPHQAARCSYTVVAGDNCYAIATSKFKITLDDFYKFNPGKQASGCLIFPDEKLQVPCGVEPQQPPKATLGPSKCVEYYKAKVNDSCWNISVLKSVSLDYIKQWNGLTDPCPIQPGQDLCVAAFQQPRCENGYTYRIKSGDSCWDIAHREEYKTTVPELTALNPNLLGIGCTIFPGQEICVRGVGPAKRETATQPDRPLEAVVEAGGINMVNDFVGNRTDPAPIPKSKLKEDLKVALEKLDTDGKVEEMTGMERELSEVKKTAQGSV